MQPLEAVRAQVRKMLARSIEDAEQLEQLDSSARVIEGRIDALRELLHWMDTEFMTRNS